MALVGVIIPVRYECRGCPGLAMSSLLVLSVIDPPAAADPVGMR